MATFSFCVSLGFLLYLESFKSYTYGVSVGCIAPATHGKWYHRQDRENLHDWNGQSELYQCPMPKNIRRSCRNYYFTLQKLHSEVAWLASKAILIYSVSRNHTMECSNYKTWIKFIQWTCILHFASIFHIIFSCLKLDTEDTNRSYSWRTQT